MHHCRKDLAAKYPESFDPSVPEDLIYSGKYALTDVEPETGITVGKLVLSPTRTYAPVVKKLLATLPRKDIHGKAACRLIYTYQADIYYTSG